MNDTTTLTPPGGASADADRKLIRPTEGRVLAGVAAGLARYFGISPVVYRVAFAALVLLGGSGFILYAAAWLVIPDERRGESVVEEAISHQRDRPWLIIGVGLVGLGLILGIAGGHFWTDPTRAWVPALAIGLAILWWQRRDRVPIGHDADVTTTTSVAESRRRPPPIFSIVLAAVIVGAGVLGVLQATDTVDVDWTLALAGGVLLVGLAVAVGAFFGRVGALATLGAVLAAILVAVSTIDIPLHGPIGDRTVHPAGVLDLHKQYRQAIGNLELDLRDVRFPGGRTEVSASVGIGKLTVTVPRNVIVETTADVTAGQTRLFGVEDNGWKVDHTDYAAGLTGESPALVLDTRVGFGEIEVRRG